MSSVANDYSNLPTIHEARLMVTWTSCPVHHQMVGLDCEGHVVGRCAGCMAEAAQALTKLKEEA